MEIMPSVSGFKSTILSISCNRYFQSLDWNQ